MGWYDSTKVNALTALQRRLRPYYGRAMDCRHVDVHIAFKQCMARLTAAIHLHKAITKWLIAHDDNELISILNPFEIIQTYLDYVEIDVADDLAILLCLATHLERCQNVGIASGFKLLDLAVMEELVEGVRREKVKIAN